MAQKRKKSTGPALLTEKQILWKNYIPSFYRGNYEKAMRGQSKAAAVKAKCLDCCNWQRVEIQYCPCDTCPLWPYRPYKASPSGSKKDSEGA